MFSTVESAFSDGFHLQPMVSLAEDSMERKICSRMTKILDENRILEDMIS